MSLRGRNANPPRAALPSKARSSCSCGDVPRKSFHVGDRMHHRILHVAAKLRASLGNQRDAAAGHRFRANQAEALFNAGQHQQIALPQQLGHIVAMVQCLDARMGQHRRQFLPVSGQKFAGDQKCPVARSRRLQPGLQGEMQPFAHRANTDEIMVNPRLRSRGCGLG